MAQVLGRLVFPADVATGAAGAGTVGVCDLDEDAATFAVEAARAAIAQAAVEPASIQRIVVHGAGAGTVSTLQTALGTAATQVVENAPDPGGPGSCLEIEIHAPRAGKRDGVIGRQAGATATVKTPAARPTIRGAAARTPTQTAPVVGTADRFERLVKAEEEALRSVPMGAHIPKATWDASLEARYRLLASLCDTCQAGHHPPLPICPVCGNATRTISLWKPGRLYSWTSVASGPTEFDPWLNTWGEYVVAVVEYEHGIRVAGILRDADPNRLVAGEMVEPILRRVFAQEGAWRYGVKFRHAGT